MGSPPQPDVLVFRGPDRNRCAELGLVLDSARIPVRIVPHREEWWLLVPEGAVEQARREIADYRSEAPRIVPAPIPAPLGGGMAGALGYTAVLSIVGGMTKRLAFGTDWIRVGRLQAGLTVDGQWWRSVTALTLHVDAAHLVANLAFGWVLGLLAAQALGGGVAWLAILISGALGNALDAILQPARHSAIGASTAVFGALGLLVALAFDRRSRPTAGAVRWLSPVIAGFLILVYTGLGGERTDVLAHLTGLAAGVAVGVVAARLPRSLLEKTEVQLGAAGVAVAIVALAWRLALAT